VAFATIFVAACTPTPPRDSSAPEPSPAASEGVASVAPSAPTAAPPSSSAAPPSAEPASAPPTEVPASAEPTGAPSSASPGSATACAGNEDNQDFYAAVADAVDWPVYCPVLPSGWFVVEGQYRAAAGGRMEIVYRGPSDRRIELSEGSFCDDGSDCLPTGTNLGSAAFGDLDGTMLQIDDGYAIVVDGGDGPSWLLQGAKTSEDELREIGAALLRIS
jgi:hypothetical protein